MHIQGDVYFLEIHKTKTHLDLRTLPFFETDVFVGATNVFIKYSETLKNYNYAKKIIL